MVPVRVLGLAVDARMQPVVLLTPLDAGPGPRVVVPIWIGAAEAASIRIAVNGEQAPRPLAHDLMQRLLETVGATLDRVDVTRIEQSTFFAELSLATPAGPRTLDARPSDAIALASRTGTPIFVAEQVLSEAGVISGDDDVPSPHDADEKVEEFREFLDSVDPDDFKS